MEKSVHSLVHSGYLVKNMLGWLQSKILMKIIVLIVHMSV